MKTSPKTPTLRVAPAALALFVLTGATLALAGCGDAAPPAKPDRCAGWQPVRVLDPTVDYLSENDPQALEALIGHHEFGQSRRCWK